jgi:hypothetical protein
MHTGRRKKQHPQANKKKLVNKNEIKGKIGDPHWQFCSESPY